MKFIEINAESTGQIQQIWNQHSETFPPDERRDYQQFLKLWQHPEASVKGIFQKEDMVGYLVTWSLENALFLEHFEVFPAYRNRKLGAEVLGQLLSLHPTVVLETEPAELSEMAQRRIAFYERNGFQSIDTDYRQPAYDASKKPQAMNLMANRSVENLAGLHEKLYRTVYGLNSEPDAF